MLKSSMKVMKNTPHLKIGSECPKLYRDFLRIYSMYYCPFAQRTRIVLKAKNIMHQIINIHLVEKPEWFLKLNPLGKVPTLQCNDKIMFESMVICDYLDETYCDPPLYPSDNWAKAWDKSLIETFSVKVAGALYKITRKSSSSDEVKEIEENLNNGLDIFEKELAGRGTKFFFGNKPGMLDYAIFPWFERIPLMKTFYPDVLILPAQRFPKLVEYSENMFKDDAAGSTVANFDDHIKYFQSKLDGQINFDIGCEDLSKN